MKRLILIILALFLVSCNRAIAGRTPTPSATSPLPTATLTEPPTEEMCAFVEGRKSLDDVSARLEEELKKAGLPVQTANAEAYGENCVTADGNSKGFAARETDFYITLNVPDLTDETSLGSLLEQTLIVINKFPVGQTPGPNPGYVGITFSAGDQVQNLWFMQTQIVDLRGQGLKGADLYRALKGAP